MDARALRHVPNGLTLSRVLLTIATYLVVLRQHLAGFVTLVLLIVLTDILDGPIARRAGVADKFGSNLDSAADLVFYLSLPVWALAWRPDEIRPHLPVIATYTLLYLFILAVARWRTGAMGVHNRFSRASGTAGVVFAIYTIAWGWNDYLFLVVAGVAAIDLTHRAFYLRKFPAARTPG